MFYFFIAAVFISGVATFFVRKLALACGTVDVPDGNRKKHRGAVPLWGGLALFVSFWLTILGCIIIGKPYTLEVYFSKLWGIFFGSLILVVVGLVDDKKSLGVYFRFLAAIISIVVVIYGGLGLAKITHPGGGIIYLTSYQVSVPFLGAISIGQVIVFFWLLAMMFTTQKNGKTLLGQREKKRQEKLMLIIIQSQRTSNVERIGARSSIKMQKNN
jgi:UDP-GlcNAc:undecaprenyl-phosphate GlcNAc-1-phosphate transferase